VSRLGRPSLTHIDEAGNARMVDVSDKAETGRQAAAKGRVKMQAETLALIGEGKAAKGDVLAVARVAGIMAAKRTSEWIPLCHPLPIAGIQIDLALNAADSAVDITATVRTTGRTGVERAARTPLRPTALTIYDMLKAADRGMRIEDIRVVQKSGGKSGDFTQD
jgi:cyclic pyranopterin phosphate synthase